MGIEINVGSIVQTIFSTMLDFPVEVVEKPEVASGERLTSSVYLEGTWNGAVSMQCSRVQACQFAAQFLAIDPPAEVDDDVRDVMGEIANMIGGNFKASMGADVRLSLPSVIDGSDYGIHVCGSATRDEVWFSSDSGYFCVSVLSNQGTRTSRLVPAHGALEVDKLAS
jgi:chemotaxis protein CheX